MTITQENFADTAEELMKKTTKTITSTKMRNIYALCAGLAGEAKRSTEETLSSDLQGQVQYFKMRIAYECGREEATKTFVQYCQIQENIDKIGKKRENLLIFCRYMEALVAYHKFYHGAKGG